MDFVNSNDEEAVSSGNVDVKENDEYLLDVLEMVGENRELMRTVRGRKHFFGHVMRREMLENLTGMV